MPIERWEAGAFRQNPNEPLSDLTIHSGSDGALAAIISNHKDRRVCSRFD